MKHAALRDLHKLRWHLLALALLLSGAAGLAIWSYAANEQARRELDSTTAQFRQTEAKLRQVRTEEQEIKDKSALFLRLLSGGVIGEEHRLDWTEMLRDSQRLLRLPRMSYEFAPQIPLESGAAGDYAFYASAMRIQMQLVHEYDLINFLDLVQRQAKALVVVRSCNVRRPGAQGGETGNNLIAECDLDWITARGASAPAMQ